MSKPLTRTQINEKKFRRINDKSLRQLLIHRFLNDYGYDKGEVTATAIVDDILKIVEDYFVITLPLEKLATGDSTPRGATTSAMDTSFGWLSRLMNIQREANPSSKPA